MEVKENSLEIQFPITYRALLCMNAMNGIKNPLEFINQINSIENNMALYILYLKNIKDTYLLPILEKNYYNFLIAKYGERN